MTLLELTVVILVLLSLITILFIGARAWKIGADRSANILNIRNVQMVVRAHANLLNLNIGDPLSSVEVVGSGQYLNAVTSPSPYISYSFMTEVPAVGVLYLKQTYAEGTELEYAPSPSLYESW